jgi:hypothetical protein
LIALNVITLIVITLHGFHCTIKNQNGLYPKIQKEKEKKLTLSAGLICPKI